MKARQNSFGRQLAVKARQNSFGRQLAVKACPRPHAVVCKNEQGSTLPLLIGIFLLVLSVFMISANIFALRVAKMNLEVLGEDLLSSVYQEINYQEYFFGNSESVTTYTRSWLPFDCGPLIRRTGELSRNLRRSVRIDTIQCSSSRLTLLLTEEVPLPFQPGFLSTFKPVVFANVSGGVQRVR